MIDKRLHAGVKHGASRSQQVVMFIVALGASIMRGRSTRDSAADSGGRANRLRERIVLYAPQLQWGIVGERIWDRQAARSCS